MFAFFRCVQGIVKIDKKKPVLRENQRTGQGSITYSRMNVYAVKFYYEMIKKNLSNG